MLSMLFKHLSYLHLFVPTGVLELYYEMVPL